MRDDPFLKVFLYLTGRGGRSDCRAETGEGKAGLRVEGATCG
jgi:hypothetical protein